MQTIGDRIRSLREALGMSQDELARKLGYQSRSSINKIESDARNLTQSKIKAIADALGVSPGYIMGWDDDKPDHWSIEFRNSLDELLHSIDSSDAYETGVDLRQWQAIASGKTPLSLEDCCNVCDAAGTSLDEMVGLREKKATESNGSPDEVSMKIADIILRLSPAQRAEALHYLQYLESKSEI